MNFKRFYLEKYSMWWGLLFIIVVSTLSQILFSKLGFNPTDDGFILAGAGRILEGQIAHVNFISIRPPGSYFLHAPFLFFGDYTIWMSRYFVWFQFACISWIWVKIIGDTFDIFHSNLEKFCLAFIAFILSVNNFPIMAWHTIDAIFFSSLGIFLCYQNPGKIENIRIKSIIGYLLIGITPLFRQNFIILIPLILILLNDWRKKEYLIVSVFPVTIYIIYLIINNAVIDVIIQIGSYSILDIFRQTVSYSNISVVIGILLGIYGSYLIYIKIKIRSIKTDLCAIIILFGVIIIAIISIPFSLDFYSEYISFILFGVVLGILAFQLLTRNFNYNLINLGILICLLAWVSSLSIGYNRPALISGSMALFIIGYVKHEYKKSGSGNKKIKKISNKLIIHPNDLKTFINVLILLMIILSIISFLTTREVNIYRETESYSLNYDLGDVLVGGKLIKTDENTYNLLQDLNNIKNNLQIKGKKIVVIPDLSAYWIQNQEINILIVDWPQYTELKTPQLQNRVITDLENKRGTYVIAMEKYDTKNLAFRLMPINENYSPLINYVRLNFKKIGETEFFELYE